MAKSKAQRKKGLALITLGIVAILAIVGLVLLFKGSLTGKHAAENVYAKHATGLGPKALDEVSSRREGQAPKPEFQRERLETGFEASKTWEKP